MNIHFYAGDKLTAQEAKRRGLSIGSAKGTHPPRTRDNTNTALPHNAYPGGKRLRRAMAVLAHRITTTPTKGTGYQKPGSMRSN